MTTYSGLYEFNSIGLDAFQKVFSGKLDDSVVDPTDASIVSLVRGTGSFTPSDFATSKDMAEAVISALGNGSIFELLPKTGLWAWLTFIMRDQLFKKASDGTWQVGESHRWYPSNANDWQKGQRHLVRMPVLLLGSLG